MTKKTSFIAAVASYLALYFPIFKAGFVYDDFWTIVQNTAIQNVTPLRFFTDPSTVAAASSGLTSDIYRPLSTLSFSIVYEFWKLNPLPYHLLNFFFHAVNAFLVFTLAKRVLKTEKSAAFAAFVFLIHPVQAQTVSWATQWGGILSCAGFLSALIFLSATTLTPLKSAGATGAVLISLFSKETGILIYPCWLFMALQLKQVPENQKPSPRWNRHILVLIPTALYLAARTIHLSWSQFGNFSSSGNVALGLIAFPLYLLKLLLPLKLRPSYDYPPFDPVPVLIGFTILSAFIILLFLMRKRTPRLVFSLAWILITLLPYLQLTPIRAFFADRFLYVPVAGFAISAGLLYESRAWSRIPLIAWTILLLFITFRSVPHWGNEERLWAYGIKQEPTNAFAHACYAQSVSDKNIAIQHYKLALMNKPSSEIEFASATHLARIYFIENQPRRARAWAEISLKLRPDNPHGLEVLGRARLLDRARGN